MVSYLQGQAANAAVSVIARAAKSVCYVSGRRRKNQNLLLIAQPSSTLIKSSQLSGEKNQKRPESSEPNGCALSKSGSYWGTGAVAEESSLQLGNASVSVIAAADCPKGLWYSLTSPV